MAKKNTSVKAKTSTSAPKLKWISTMEGFRAELENGNYFTITTIMHADSKKGIRGYLLRGWGWGQPYGFYINDDGKATSLIQVIDTAVLAKSAARDFLASRIKSK